MKMGTVKDAEVPTRLERLVEVTKNLRFSMVGIQVDKIVVKKTAAPTCKVRLVTFIILI